MTNSYAPSRQPAPRNRSAAPSLTDPVRYPAERRRPVLTKRAFLLILMTLLVPGSAQTVAGDRRLGRIALRVTLTVWVLAIVAAVLLVASRSTLINLFTSSVASLLLIVGLAGAGRRLGRPVHQHTAADPARAAGTRRCAPPSLSPWCWR